MPQLVDGVRAAGECFARRESAGQLLAVDAERISRACYDLARQFHRGGTLIVFGNGGASTDAQHISVEFVHPVIVGKRALPSISLTNDIATLTGVAQRLGFAEVFAHQVRRLAGAQDIALGLSEDGKCENVLRGLQAASELGLLTVALTGGDGGLIAASPAVDHVLVVHADDPLVIKEMHVTLYHVLWELAHVFFEQPGVLDPEVLR